SVRPAHRASNGPKRSNTRDRGLARERTEKRSRRSLRRRRSKTMARETETGELEMERAAIVGTSLQVSRVALGTWAIGGWMWGGTDEAESIATIRAAVRHRIQPNGYPPASC